MFDANGLVSKPIDVVIADSLVCAHFETAGGTRYYPCESVVAVGQVKSSVTAKKRLRHALENLESVKRLDRSARGRAIDSRFDEAINHRDDHLHQIFSFIFVIVDAISGGSIQELVLDHILLKESHLWPNVIQSVAGAQAIVAFAGRGSPVKREMRNKTPEFNGQRSQLVCFTLLS